MNTLPECARHSAVIEVTCRSCGRAAYFDPANLKEWVGVRDCTLDVRPLRCSVLLEGFRCCPARGVDRSAVTPLPPRPPRNECVVRAQFARWGLGANLT
jgi:hypothetical protein